MQEFTDNEPILSHPRGIDPVTEHYWKILDVNLAWIRQSDTKAFTIFMIYGLSISLAFSNIESIATTITSSLLMIILAVLYLVASMIAVIFGFRCIQPQLEHKFPSSIVFFGSIAKEFEDPKKYHEQSQKIISDPELFQKELCNQIYINSKIAQGKFNDIHTSILFFLISLIIMALVMIKFFI